MNFKYVWDRYLTIYFEISNNMEDTNLYRPVCLTVGALQCVFAYHTHFSGLEFDFLDHCVRCTNQLRESVEWDFSNGSALEQINAWAGSVCLRGNAMEPFRHPAKNCSWLMLFLNPLVILTCFPPKYSCRHSVLRSKLLVGISRSPVGALVLGSPIDTPQKQPERSAR